MNVKSLFQVALASLVGVAVGAPVTEVFANSAFGQQEINQGRAALMATPYNGGDLHQLTVLEQVNSEKACWSEQGSGPITINPLLLNFDFTGICARGVDGNGYSIRINGEDMYLRYTPRIVEKNGELVLIGKPNRKGVSPIVIARSHGSVRSFSKLILEPGWQITKRVYQGQVLDHFYLTKDQPSVQTADRAAGNTLAGGVKMSNEF
jgi:N-acetylmuramoyl-L-alanine amidase